MKYLITGGSGYIGSRLVELLVAREDTERIVITDMRPPAVPWPKTTLRPDGHPRPRHACAAGGRGARRARAPGLRPEPDARRARRCTTSTSTAPRTCSTPPPRAGIEHLLVASSTTAYGAWPDNPVPLTEEHPVRGMPNYEYARDKTEIDRMCQLWAAQHPERTMTIVRPCIVFGPNVDNYIIRFWVNAPFIPLIDGVDIELQYVHEDDVVDALSRLLLERKAGIFNLTGDGTVKLSEGAALAGPEDPQGAATSIYRRLAAAFWGCTCRAPRRRPGSSTSCATRGSRRTRRSRRELGWQPRYTSRETFEVAMRAKGKLASAPQARRRRTS